MTNPIRRHTVIYRAIAQAQRRRASEKEKMGFMNGFIAGYRAAQRDARLKAGKEFFDYDCLHPEVGHDPVKELDY